MMDRTDAYYYSLPEELIAQEPLPDRSASRMLVLDRRTDRIEHRTVRDLPEFFRPGDALVLNDSRVITARLLGRKRGSGGRVDLLFLEEERPSYWAALVRASGRIRPGLVFEDPAGEWTAEVVEIRPTGGVSLQVTSGRPLSEILEARGLPPLPPYIRRFWGSGRGDPAQIQRDRERYQTVYARLPGSVAAPTAGLHLTNDLLNAIRNRGVILVHVTLHVGLGTFKPIEADSIERHVMHEERFELTEAAAEALNRVREGGGRIAAVGTTSVRVLETTVTEERIFRAECGRTRLFIHPPYRFRAVDVLLTNFHLPRSSLLVLVSAFAGRERILRAYEEAIRTRYRFFSYGDAMLIL